MAEENKQDWGFYIIPDLRTWAFPNEYEQQTQIEHFSTFEEAKARFDELRNKPYNFEKALGHDGQSAARLTFGVEKKAAAFDIIHVRDGENVLVTDFTRDENFSQDNSLLAIIRKTATEIGFDKVNHYPLLENGRYGKAMLVPFDKWASENPQYDLAIKAESHDDITIPDNIEKFYVDRENEEVKWVYYNPNGAAGGQLVDNYFSFDKLREAFSINENSPLDEIAKNCQQFRVDKGTVEFSFSARRFLNSSYDFTNEDNDFLGKLRAVSLKIGDVVRFKYSRSGEPPKDYNAVVMSVSHKDKSYVRGCAFGLAAYDAQDTAFVEKIGDFGFGSALAFARQYSFEYVGRIEKLREQDREQNAELYSALDEHKTIFLQLNGEQKQDSIIAKAQDEGYENFRLKYFDEDVGEIEKGYVVIADKNEEKDVPLLSYGELSFKGLDAQNIAFDLKTDGLSVDKSERTEKMEEAVLPLYKQSIAYAKENGETTKWRESFDETRRCAGALQKLIAENHADMSLKTKPVIESAVAEFGAERVSLVLASTIQMRTGDGRISPANREWANGIEVPQDGYTNRILVNSHSCLIDGVVDDYKQFLLDIEKNLAKKQEISDTHLNGGTTMEHETTFEVSSMLKIDDGSAVKALANVVINGEIAINNLKVMESAAGNLNVVMPSKMGAKGYEDVAFPITSEARAMLQNAVMSNFEKLVASGEQKLKNDLQTDKTKPAVSDLKVTLSEVKHATVKAAGEVKIDDCFVIKDVKVMQPKDPTKPLFVSMPSYPNSRGGYTEFALPITTAMHAKLNEEVAVKAYRSMEQVTYKGVKYAELGDKSKGEIAATNKLNIGFAEKLMSELDKAGVTYQARVGSKSGTVISVNIADKPRLDEVQKNLTAALNAPKQDVSKQDAPKPHHARH